MEHDAFVSGKFDTGFVQDHFKPEMLDESAENEIEIAALFTAYLDSENGSQIRTESVAAGSTSNWKRNRT